MCLEDVRIARATTSNRLNTSVTTSIKAIVSHAPNRYAIIFMPPSSGTISINCDSGVAVGEGISIPAGGAPVILKLGDVGDLVRRGFWAIMSAGTVNYHWVEVFFDERNYRPGK
jgi:hypothetical protein